MIRVAVVGQMVGRNRGYVTTQGEILSDGLREKGYPVFCVSSLPNRYLRIADIIRTIILRKRDVDLQCIQVYSGPGFLIADIASKIGKLIGQPIVMVLHGGALQEFMARFPLWTCRVLKRADALIAPSAFLARAVVPYGFHVQVIPNIIHLSHYPYRYRQIIGPRLFWMRQFHPIYNPDLAIRVLARLKDEIPEASLVMGGQSGILELEVRRLAEKIGVASSIRFLGYLDMAAKVKEGDAADIFLNTNHIDNMPVAVVEACAMGLPVVATAVGGVPDLLTHEETGLLVPDDDDDAMAGAVMRLLADSKLTGRLSAKGRQLAVHSSWEEIFPQWERVFNEVMDSREQLR